MSQPSYVIWAQSYVPEWDVMRALPYHNKSSSVLNSIESGRLHLVTAAEAADINERCDLKEPAMRASEKARARLQWLEQYDAELQGPKQEMKR